MRKQINIYQSSTSTYEVDYREVLGAREVLRNFLQSFVRGTHQYGVVT